MFSVYENDEVIGVTQAPKYVYRKPKSGSLVRTTDADKADAVIYEGELCNLVGKDKINEEGRTLGFAEIDGGLPFRGFKEGIDNANDTDITILMAITDLYEAIASK